MHDVLPMKIMISDDRLASAQFTMAGQCWQAFGVRCQQNNPLIIDGFMTSPDLKEIFNKIQQSQQRDERLIIESAFPANEVATKPLAFDHIV